MAAVSGVISGTVAIVSTVADSVEILAGVELEAEVVEPEPETVRAILTGADGQAIDVETMGTRAGLAVSYPELLTAVGRLAAQLETINRQLADITGQEDPL